MPKSGDKTSKVWQVLSSNTVYNYPLFVRLKRQTVQLPDSGQVDDYHWLDMPDYSPICPVY